MKQNDLKITIIENTFKWIDSALLIVLPLVILGKLTVHRNVFCSLDAVRTFLSDFFQLRGLSLCQWVLLALSLWIWNAVLNAMRMYQYAIIEEEEWKVFTFRSIVAITIGLGCLSLLLYTCHMFLKTGTLAFHDSVTMLGIWASIFFMYRIVSASVLRLNRTLQQQEDLPYALIAGVNERSLAFAEKINFPIKRYVLIGYADDDYRRDTLKNKSKAPLLCSLGDIEGYISENRVDILFIMLPLRGFYDTIAEILIKCKIQGVEARVVNDFFDLPFIQPDRIEEDFLDCDFKKKFSLQYDLKRLLDLLSSLFGLLLLFPLLSIIALALYIDDGWPVFFIQERVGLNKRRFKMWKFRTMVKDAEQRLAELEALNEVQGAAFKLTEDPRVTKLGKFLRKTSLDELPQLINVVQGNMSLVGPRPLPIRDFERFYRNQHRKRFSVKPGITGRWQISGRSDVDFEEWMALDLEYIDNWKLCNDIEILSKTVIAVARCKGAK
ncbi:MAG: exopolysaccharide biosynthesis polyprenyl glycosylphosphotransferase [Candidatus Electrothrix scaldis]|nr:MAG: exopolysaccharide biosynthesis polyprenyl glycosylphosphotransferase [Candidatus Electrothrix sp. GW3-3]